VGLRRQEGRRGRRRQGVRHAPVQERPDPRHRRAGLDDQLRRARHRGRLIAWENEALLARKDSKEKLEIVVPSVSILAEPPVAVVDRYAGKHKTKDVAKAYLDFLYTPEGQELAAKHFFRPVSPRSREVRRDLPEDDPLHDRRDLRRMAKAQKAHFADGGTFDQIYQGGK
jgi:sulfate transport system substrate-binding protein